MFWDIGRVTKFMTRAGARLRSNFAPPAASLRSTSTPRPATTPPATEGFSSFLRAPSFAEFVKGGLFVVSLFFAAVLLAQDPPPPSIPVPSKQPPPPGQASGGQGSTIKVGVNLVVLHTTVLDDRGR